MKNRHFFGLLVVIIWSCKSVKLDLIKYNETKELYGFGINENNTYLLRNEHNELISNKNVDAFKSQLNKHNFAFLTRDQSEKSAYLKPSDIQLNRLYGDASKKIKNKQYREALSAIESLKKIYPSINLYSDIYFLQAFCYEKLNLTDSANTFYNRYLDFSSSKFSARMRGYKHADKNDSLWLFQKKYSKNFLLGLNPTLDDSIFIETKPKFLNLSYRPGFVIDRELLLPNHNSEIMPIWYINSAGDLGFNIQSYHKLNHTFDFNPSIIYSRNYKELSLALPIKVYHSHNHRLGIKVSPFISYIQINKIKLENTTYNLNESLINMGAKLSFGYYFTQKFSFGTYYLYNFYNQYYYKTFELKNVNVWYYNNYDASIFYNIFDNFSLKTGIRNNAYVAGIVWYGFEISFDFSQSKLILLFDLK